MARREVDFEEFLERIRQSADYRGQIAYVHRVAACRARYAEPVEPLSGASGRMLAAMGLERLYLHQARALDAVRGGRDILVTTATASGKTLCYLLPIIEALEREPGARVLAIYPTKALSQDQWRVFERARVGAGLDRALFGVVDGDTPSAQRRRFRDQAAVVITNPDMLHAAIMPQHPRWADFFARLRYVVVDELHTYTGLLGANVANLFRRLGRLCRHYGSAPRFLASSATIANPAELARKVLGRRVELIDDDGSPSGPRTYVLWNPPRVRATRWRSRRSANVEAQELMAALVEAGVPTITFSKAKVTAELIYRYVREALGPALAEKVAPYRGGYLAAERRQIEKRLFEGQLMGVSTTPALELGIDIGELDASIVVGYPGTLASFFQQSGRAGRRDRPSLVILVALDTTINQYIVRHPEYLFGRPVEEGVVQADNPYVVMNHLRCAAHELPLADGETETFGPHARLALEVLESERKVYRDAERGLWFHSAPEVPQHEVSLRDYADRTVAIVDVSDGEKVIGQLNKFDAPPIIHPEAIYLHRGQTYYVEDLDLERAIARVRPVEVDYYTQPLGGTDVDHIDHPLRERPFGAGKVCFGEVTVHFRNDAYERIHFHSLDAISVHGIRMPVLYMETTAFWLVPSEEVCRRVLAAGLDPHAGCRGIGYATRMALPLFVRCDTLSFSHSVGAANAPWQAIFVYERYPLGLGFTERAYEIAGRLMPAVLDHIRQCDCDDGCPCCVGKPLRQYATWNVERYEGSIPSKAAAIMVLEGLLGDGSRLDEPEAAGLGHDHQRLILERSLRRRLQRHGEPLIAYPHHHFEPRPAAGYPEPEPRERLKDSDVARRAFRRLRQAKAIARGRPGPTRSTPKPNISASITSGGGREAQEPLVSGASADTELAQRLLRERRGAPEGRTCDGNPERPRVEQPMAIGDPLARKARKLRRTPRVNPKANDQGSSNGAPPEKRV